jgi:hypothetical protein
VQDNMFVNSEVENITFTSDDAACQFKQHIPFANLTFSKKR